MIELLINIIIAGLLLVTIYYCWRLNQFLSVLRSGREELAIAVEEFNQAVNRAQHSVESLKSGSQQAVDKLAVKIEKAEFMADDLAYLIDKANKLADKLQQHASPQTTPKAEPAPSTKGTATARAQQAKDAAVESAKTTNPKGLESISRKISPADNKMAETSPKSQTGERPKSRAEIELIEALKSIR